MTAVDVRAFAPDLSVRWLVEQPDVRHRSIDGALVFLDISGFTALSEALAGRGRVGAEEVRDVIDATFRAILAEAYELGGSLLKFGGDAVLLLFEGDGAPVRAAAAGRVMLDVLLARNPVRTSGGPITLGATVGVDAGPVDLALVGRSHRELLVMGPTTSRTIRTESSADADQVLVTASVAAGLDPAVLGTGPDGAAAVMRVPDAPRPGHRPRSGTSDVASALLPRALRHRLIEGGTAGQHRRATVAFVKVAGTDGLLAAGAPQDVVLELDRIVSSAQDACDRHGVTWLASDADVDGCKLILAAGVPSGDDDDDDRVVHVAREVAAMDGRLTVRIGIHRGPLFSGVVGPEHRLTYTVLGDAVNVAARTMARAGPGQVLATSTVLNGLRTLYDVTMLEPFAVKGKTQPVVAGAVREELGVRVRRRVDDTPFVGRRALLDRLVAAVDEAGRQGKGQVLELVGAAGIGKSRVIDELTDERPRVPIHLVACTRFSVDRPYRTVAMLLRLVLTGERHGSGEAVLAAARDALGEAEEAAWLPLLGPVYDVDVPLTPQMAELDAANVPGRIRDLIGSLLALSLPDHALLVVEDAHFLDPESRAMLDAAFTQLLAQRGWVLVLTAREPVGLEAAAEQVEVGPLPDDDALLLALGFVDDGVLPLELAPGLVERAGGNPLFLAELATAARGGELPDDVESLVRQRLDALPPDRARLVAHAAVLGVEFPPALLDAVAGDDPVVGAATVDDVADVLARMGSGYLRFRQSVYQEVAYEALPHRERRELHDRAAATLGRLRAAGADVAVEALSRHHHLAGDNAGSWRWSREALASAAGRFATASAIRFARRSLEAARHLHVPVEERFAVLEQLGDLLELTSAYEDAIDAYQRARRLRRPSPHLARAIGHCHERVGAYRSARRWFGIAARECGEHDEGERLRVEHRRLVSHLREGRPRLARDGAAALADRAAAHGDPHIEGQLHYVRAWAGSLLGDDEHPAQLAAARRCFEQAGDLKGEAIVCNEEGAAAYWRGDWDAAATRYRRASELHARLGDLAHVAGSDANLAEVLSDQGRFDEARELLEGATRRLEVTNQVAGLVFARQMLGRTAARMGDEEEASRWYDAAEELAARAGADGLRLDVLARRLELAAFVGDPGRADALVAELAARTDPVPAEQAIILRARGVVAWGAGDAEGAAALLEQSVAGATAAGLRYEEGLGAVAAAVLLGDLSASARAEHLLAPLGLVVAPAVLAVGPWLAAAGRAVLSVGAR